MASFLRSKGMHALTRMVRSSRASYPYADLNGMAFSYRKFTDAAVVAVLLSDENDILFNLALEQYLMEPGVVTKPTLYLWRNDKTVVIGRHQNPWRECNLEDMEKNNVTLARRYSGGGAVYQDLGNLCFTFLRPGKTPEKQLNSQIILKALANTYSKIVVRFLQLVRIALSYANAQDIKGEISGRNDLTVNGCKTSAGLDYGCYIGTILIDVDLGGLSSCLTPHKLKLKSKGIASISARVVNLKEVNADIDYEGIKNSLLSEFYNEHNIPKANAPEPERISRISPIVHKPVFKKHMDVLSAWDWRFGKTPEFGACLEARFDWGLIELHLDVSEGIISKTKVFSDCLDTEIVNIIDRVLPGNFLPLYYMERNLEGLCTYTIGVPYQVDAIVSAFKTVSEVTPSQPDLRIALALENLRQGVDFADPLSVISISMFKYTLSASKPHTIQNLVDGQWTSSKFSYDVVDPLNGEVFIKSPHVKSEELAPFIQSLKKVPKSGLHNPLKNPERYVLYGSVMQKAAEYLHDPSVNDFFTKCIQRTMPKSYAQAQGEVNIIRTFCENFSGDSVRFMVKGFSVPGNHLGQQSHGYRWPYGATAIISPYNFPLEIPIMQALGAVMVGNKTVLKTEASQGMPVEQFLRFLLMCGMPAADIDFINTRGPVMPELLEKGCVRLVQFTGSTDVAESLCKLMKGRVRIEDAGYDWKILGADISNLDYVAWQCDQDAYAISGQKCSAQSLLMAHSNWVSAGLFGKLKVLASRRSLSNLTLSPVLSYTTQEIDYHVKKLAGLPGARILFGGKALEGHRIPEKYGAYEPTAVFVPLDSILGSNDNFALATTELFGPVQVITEWMDGEEDRLIETCERMSHHLTAAVVSTDMQFLEKILGNTVNGTTYAGPRARTTGAPQNHWFGPAGDPCGAGIGTREAILHTWTCHREIVQDHGPITSDWVTPACT